MHSLGLIAPLGWIAWTVQRIRQMAFAAALGRRFSHSNILRRARIASAAPSGHR